MYRLGGEMRCASRPLITCHTIANYKLPDVRKYSISLIRYCVCASI